MERDCWSKLLPKGPLPDTGVKTFEVGDVWAFWVPDGTSPGVVKITGRPKPCMGNHWDCEDLTVDGGPPFIATTSRAARHAVLLRRVVPCMQAAHHSALSCAEDAPLVKAPVDRPRYAAVTEKIMVKAEMHRKAGRGGAFSQVFVPMDDFEALREYFGGEPCVVQTSIGPMSVHPINPDGATFSD